MKLPERPSRLIELIESNRREDGTVHMSIGVSSRERLNEVAEKLSRQGRIDSVSRYVPFFDLVLPTIEAADRFVKDYDANRKEGDFEHVDSIEIPADYVLAQIGLPQ